MRAIGKYDYYSVTAALLWGINYVAVKSVLEALPESSFLLIRFFLAVGLLLLYLAATGEGFGIRRGDYAQILLLGVLGVGFYNIFWTVGIHKTTASNAALIVSTSPLFAQLYTQAVGRQRISGRQWAFTLLAFFGLFLMISQSPGADFDFGSQYFIGNILVFIGALLFASYTVFAKPLLERYSPIKLNALAMAFGLPVLAAYCFIGGPPSFSALSWPVLFKMLYIIVFGTVAAYICWYSGVKRVGPVKVILFHYIVPVSSMVLGALLLQESVNPAQVLGGALALGGVMAARVAA